MRPSNAAATAAAAAAKIQRARAGLVLDAPFFGSLVLRLQAREDPSVETAWTDGQDLGYNPDWIAGLPLEQVKGILAHESMHLAAAHHARRQDRDPRRWNVAGDGAINDLLIAAGFRLPSGAVAGYGTDKAAEQIYATLPPDPPGPPDQSGQSGQSDQSGEDPGRSGAVRDAPGQDGRPATAAELAQAEADSRVAVSQAAQAARACGSLPAGIARLVEDILEPRVPWREVLRRFVDEAARNDYSWQSPSRRYLAAGLYLPSLRSRQLGTIAIAVDTSGSIDQPALDGFAAEIAAMAEDTRPASVVAISCDAAVQSVEEFAPDEPIRLSPRGGGGTDFRPPFAEIERRDLAPVCLIYLTDGECSLFPAPPEYPVLWAITGRARDFRPPFGEVISMPPEGR